MAQTLFGNINWQITDGQGLNVPDQDINWTLYSYSRSGTININLPIERYSKLDKSLTYRMRDLPTLRHLLGAIYAFYASPISAADIQRLQDPSIQDTFGYIKDATTKFNIGQQVPYIELMGDLKYFEGLIFKGSGTYDLNLGS